MRLYSILMIATVTLCACGSDVRDRENYGDLTGPGAIVLGPDNHKGGYGRQECLLCHNAVLNIHQRPGSGIDVEALNDAIRNGGESKYCQICHGTNGTN